MTMLTEATSLSEASLTGKTWKIRVIEGDRQGSSAYYPAKTLEEGAHLFAKGTRIFRNHPSADDRHNQPERRVEDIIGYLSEDAEFDGKDLYANATFIESERARIKELAEAGVIAMSIRAQGEMAESGELKKFTAVHSVDVVTVAGAGGAFTQVLESGRVPESEAASESVAESTQEEEITMEFPKELAEALDALVQTSKKNTEDIAALVEASKPKPEEPEAFEFAKAVLALDEAELPKASRARVLTVIEAQGDYAAAIEAEKAIADEIRESLKAESFKGAEVEESKNEDLDFSTIFGG